MLDNFSFAKLKGDFHNDSKKNKNYYLKCILERINKSQFTIVKKEHTNKNFLERHIKMKLYGERECMTKKVYLVITIFMVLSLSSGIPHLIERIHARGMAGVNYGIVGFPILIGTWSFCKYKKAE